MIGNDQSSTTFPSLALPPGHFLSLPPSYAAPSDPDTAPSSSQTTSAHASNGLAPNIASLASADFDVDVRTGFLPADRNVERLKGQWEVWEEALDAARGEGPGDGLVLGAHRDRELLWRKGVQSVRAILLDDGGEAKSSRFPSSKSKDLQHRFVFFVAHTSFSLS
jgi:indoleamine 2,3-dioxygenase